MSHVRIDPAIFYWGTPVVLITTINPDDEGSPNIAPMSSAWWLGDRCVLGFDASSQTTKNLRRTRQCVLNLPSDAMFPAVNALARTTGTEEVPPMKALRGYRYVKDKFALAELTPQPSEAVAPPRIQECPVQMEARMVDEHALLGDRPEGLRGLAVAIEVKIVRTYVAGELKLAGWDNRIDSDKLKLILMSFGQLYGMREGRLGESEVAKIDEETLRVPAEEEETT